MKLQAVPVLLADAFLITVPKFQDDRGYFKESYVSSKYKELNLGNFVQDNLSFSARNVLRGLHMDSEMAKLVQVLRGRAFDVIVDARKESPTFGNWQSFELSEDDDLQLYIPSGFLHGFLALTDNTLFSYKQTAEYDPNKEIQVRWSDPTLAINWPLPEKPRTSPKDEAAPFFTDVFET
jgi:dTDP-4-dehydrorhamnose 3,5-epimerase